MTPQQIIAAVAAARGLDVAKVIGPRRPDALVAARIEIAIKLAAPPWNLSTYEIGRLLHRDHSSIVSLLKGGKGKVRPRLQGAPAAVEGNA